MWELDVAAYTQVYIAGLSVGERYFWFCYGVEHYPRLKSYAADTYTEQVVLRITSSDGKGSTPYFRIYRRNET